MDNQIDSGIAILNIAFDEVIHIIGDYYYVVADGKKQLYDVSSRKLYRSTIIDIKIIENRVALVTASLKVLKICYILYNTGERFFCEAEMKLLFTTDRYDVFCENSYSGYKKSAVIDRVTKKRIINQNTSDIQREDNGLIVIESATLDEYTILHQDGTTLICEY